ncbi:hypothetical protein FHL15_001100 [Xylaria flabelliformis]|uniref:Uncharacterized protein n=1 Tax=Xylaria flabelliformis TaxID=2512241 RepID=A0A553ICH2_9PEZI|nr:hypothetical protein FHL15_001100 [Xylaria flabelliformis]
MSSKGGMVLDHSQNAAALKGEYWAIQETSQDRNNHSSLIVEAHFRPILDAAVRSRANGYVALELLAHYGGICCWNLSRVKSLFHHVAATREEEYAISPPPPPPPAHGKEGVVRFPAVCNGNMPNLCSMQQQQAHANICWMRPRGVSAEPRELTCPLGNPDPQPPSSISLTNPRCDRDTVK